MRQKTTKSTIFDASDYSIAILAARFNSRITQAMVKEAFEFLAKYQVVSKKVAVYWVPGSIELPITLSLLAKTGKYDCLIALGCIIRGETAHFTYVAKIASEGILQIMLSHDIPIGFGVLTTDTIKQAEARIQSAAQSAVAAALEVARIKRSLKQMA